MRRRLRKKGLKNGIYLLAVLSIAIIIVHIAYEESEQIRWYSAALNLAYSYLAAFIFYLFQLFFPEQRRRRLAQKVLLPDIEKLVEEFGFFIAFVDMVMLIEEDNVTIHEDNETIFYSKTDCDDQVIHEYKKIRKVLQGFFPRLEESISKIKGNKLYEFLDEQVIDLLAEIEAESITLMRAVGQLYPKCKFFQGIGEDYDKIKDYYLRLSTAINKQYPYKLQLMNEKEKVEYQKSIEEYKGFSKEINLFLEQTTVKN